MGKREKGKWGKSKRYSIKVRTAYFPFPFYPFDHFPSPFLGSYEKKKFSRLFAGGFVCGRRIEYE
ncbi:MAG: hypothetical protein M3430_12495 [Acidobacteriota bacterium]|nr:hypothetical protein [Acidobacteriota bacterium]